MSFPDTPSVAALVREFTASRTPVGLRALAVQNLGATGALEAVAPVLRALRASPHESVRERAAWAVASLASTQPAALLPHLDETEEVFADATREDQLVIQGGLLCAFRHLPAASLAPLVPALQAAFSHPRSGPGTRAEIAEVAAPTGTPAAALLPLMDAVLATDYRADVVRQSAAALRLAVPEGAAAAAVRTPPPGVRR